MPSYVKGYWNETRGDAYNAWGTSWWYFEVDGEGWVIWQVELYDSGVLLCYSAERMEDEFGGLAEKAFDLSEAGYLAISQQEFESVWRGK